MLVSYEIEVLKVDENAETKIITFEDFSKHCKERLTRLIHREPSSPVNVCAHRHVCYDSVCPEWYKLKGNDVKHELLPKAIKLREDAANGFAPLTCIDTLCREVQELNMSPSMAAHASFLPGAFSDLCRKVMFQIDEIVVALGGDRQ